MLDHHQEPWVFLFCCLFLFSLTGKLQLQQSLFSLNICLGFAES